MRSQPGRAPAHRHRPFVANVLRLGLVALVLASCDDGQSVGTRCTSSDQCASNLCYANRCLAPSSDGDGDGLTAAQEKHLHSDPLRPDSDGDGKDDGAEVGPQIGHPIDTDGDGKPDVLESAFADGDGDCLPDEVDADDLHAVTDPALLVKLVCSHSGVCGQAGEVILATCVAGQLSCDYRAVAGWQETEVCDGVDNDCDGQIDEGFVYQGNAISMPCVGTGACGPGVVVCAAGKATCSSNPGGSQSRAQAETCNNVDDDCDGETDEDFNLLGLAVGSPCVGVGECGIGKVFCDTKGQPSCTADPGGADSHASPEICNGLDDNCDGTTDEGMTLQGAALGSPCAALGACGMGVVQCGQKGSAVCSSAPGQPESPAGEELCNGQDDDCDGLTDEGFSLDGNGLGAPCPGAGSCGPGVIACSKAGGVTCSTLADGPASQATPEVCNGQDDDCDGLTDEKLAWQGLVLGAACPGQGLCGAGTVVCGSTGQPTCSTLGDGPKSQAVSEVCNGQDDDCDGQTDEGLLAPADFACAGAGVCATLTGIPQCAAALWTCSYDGQPGYQTKELTCNGQDDDCDGLTDEGLATEWTATTAWDDGRPLARRQFAWAADLDGAWLWGGLEPSASGDEVAARDVWRFSAASGLYKRVSKSTLPPILRGTLIPVAVDGQVVALRTLGGLDADGLPAPSLELDLALGSWSSVPLAAPPTPVVDAVAGTVAGQVWLFGDDQSGQTLIQRQNIAQASWDGGVPQLPAGAAHASACGGAGAWYALAWTADGAPWFGTLGPGAASWIPLAINGLNVVGASGGHLICTPSEVAWFGGRSTLKTPVGAWRYVPAKALWSPILEPNLPDRMDSIVFTSSAGLAIVQGETAPGQVDPSAWLRGPQGWHGADGEPEFAVGAQWLSTTTGLLRLGGLAPRGATLQAVAGAWRWAGGAWQWLPMPAGVQGRALAQAVLAEDGSHVLLWSGATQVSPAQLLTGAGLTVATGALSLDLVTGVWSADGMDQASQLPSVKPDSAGAATLDAKQRYLFTQGPTENTSELWSLTWPKGKTLLWKSANGPGPAWRQGTALAYDPLFNRLILAQVDGQLALWSLALSGTPQWQQVAVDPTVVAGRAVLLGAPGYPNRLLMVLPPPGKGSAAFRQLQLAGPDVAWQQWLGVAPSWSGVASATWFAEAALVEGMSDADGRYRTSRERFANSCP